MWVNDRFSGTASQRTGASVPTPQHLVELRHRLLEVGEGRERLPQPGRFACRANRQGDQDEGQQQRHDPDHAAGFSWLDAAFDQPVEPALALQLEVELDQVVRGERRTDVLLGQLERQVPDLHPDPGGHQQVNDCRVGRLGHRHPALRAAECVRALLDRGAHADDNVRRTEFDVPAFRARGSDRYRWDAPFATSP
jgi:hypothetical protein